jgi:putative phosphoribosyl transferase
VFHRWPAFLSREQPYADRAEAGAVLAERLTRQLAGWAEPDRLLVLGLPRGGIPVAGPVAAALAAPLDVLLVRKVGLPGQPELAMGAIAAIGDRIAVVRNSAVLRECRVPAADFGAACRAELATLREQSVRYRGSRGLVQLADRLVIVVDDGLATGASMRAALATLRAAGAERLVVAVPIGSPRTCRALAEQVSALVCPWQPLSFGSVSQGYRNFGQTSDDEVIRILAEQR